MEQNKIRSSFKIPRFNLSTTSMNMLCVFFLFFSNTLITFCMLFAFLYTYEISRELTVNPPWFFHLLREKSFVWEESAYLHIGMYIIDRQRSSSDNNFLQKRRVSNLHLWVVSHHKMYSIAWIMTAICYKIRNGFSLVFNRMMHTMVINFNPDSHDITVTCWFSEHRKRFLVCHH